MRVVAKEYGCNDFLSHVISVLVRFSAYLIDTTSESLKRICYLTYD